MSQPEAPSPADPPIQPTKSRVAFETPWFQLEEEWFENVPALRGAPHYRLVVPDGVLVLALTADGKVVFVEQYRPAVREVTLELPAGSIAPGESPEAAARRELLEETGFEAVHWQALGCTRISADRKASRDYFFLAQEAMPTQRSAERGLRVRLASFSEWREFVRNGRFQQVAGLGALVLAQWHAGISVFDRWNE